MEDKGMCWVGFTGMGATVPEPGLGFFRKISIGLRAMFPRTAYRRMFVVVIGMVLWALVVLPIFYMFSNDEYTPSSYIKIGDATLPDRLDLSVNVLRIDPTGRTTDLHIQIDPQGIYRSANHSLAIPLVAYFRAKTMFLPEDLPVDAISLTVPFLEGSVRDYPFERFSAFVPFLFHTRNNRPIPFYAEFSASIPSLRIQFNEAKGGDLVERGYIPSDALLIRMSVTRTPIVFMFCFILTCIMWALSLSIGALAYDVMILRREVPPPLLSIGVAMLFALPTVRNSQPGVPAIGCASDVLGFFWTLFIIAFSSVSLVYCYVLRWTLDLNQLPSFSTDPQT